MKTAPLITLWLFWRFISVLPSQMPARIIKASSDHIKVAPLGKGTFLNCVYSGNPAPEVYWTKNGKRLDNKCAFCVHKVQHFYRKSTLRVTPYRDTDFGGYKCRARNKLGFGDITIKLEEDKSQNISQCFRDRILASDPRLRLEFLPRCNSNGSYHVLQCSVHLDKCWCVDQSGHKIADALDDHQGKYCGRREQKDLSTVAAVVMVIGSVLLLLLIAIICYATKRRKHL